MKKYSILIIVLALIVFFNIDCHADNHICVIHLDQTIQNQEMTSDTGDILLDLYYDGSPDLKFSNEGDETVTANDFLIWKAGTVREVIWLWVSKRHKALQDKINNQNK